MCSFLKCGVATGKVEGRKLNPNLQMWTKTSACPAYLAHCLAVLVFESKLSLSLCLLCAECNPTLVGKEGRGFLCRPEEEDDDDDDNEALPEDVWGRPPPPSEDEDSGPEEDDLSSDGSASPVDDTKCQCASHMLSADFAKGVRSCSRNFFFYMWINSGEIST